MDIAMPGGGVMPALARGPTTASAAIIIVQEIFGVNASIRSLVDDWAAKGYLAVAPELYWRQGTGLSFEPETPGDYEQAYEIYRKLDLDLAVSDVAVLIASLRALGISRIGLVGFCLGGNVAFLAACRTDIDASVGYYGVGWHRMLGEAAAITHPLMLHLATEDHLVPPADQAMIHAGLDTHPLVTLHDHTAGHGFARASGPARAPAQAAAAAALTTAFFRRHLGLQQDQEK